MSTRVATIDCGTNSLRLLVADFDPQLGTLVEVDRQVRVVRLGQGVAASGQITAEAIGRAQVVLAEYRALLHHYAVAPSRVRFVATSAARDAKNVADFVTAAAETVGVTPEIITGDQEAAWSFNGAVAGIAGGTAPYLVVDIGGGSTEFVLGSTTVEAAISVDLGCVRFTEQGFPEADLDQLLSTAFASVPPESTNTLVGLAGSVTTVTAHALGLLTYDSAQVHGAELTVDQVTAACADLVAMDRDQRAALPYMHPGRTDVIVAGAMIWTKIVHHVADAAGITHVRTSERDILDGVALTLTT